MNEFRTQEEEQAFEDEVMKISTGDRKQDVMDIWFAARDFFSKPTAESEVHVFELSSEKEWPGYLAWSRSVLPDVDPLKVVRLGDIVVARNGQFELYVPSWSSESRASDETRRLEVLRLLGGVSVETLQEIDDWVSGGQSA